MQAVTFVCFSAWAWLLCSYATATATDELTLLAVKSALSDPTGSLASWNTSNRLCSWRGVTCRRRPPGRGRVVALRLNSFDLAGRVSPLLGNLSFLRTLDLSGNSLRGQIPPELGDLRRLQVLHLNDNSLEGSIPAAALRRCTKLTTLAVTHNQLQGEIPAEIGSLRNLVDLNMSSNNLSGEIPPSLANLSSIKFLDISKNAFAGAIPSSLGRLPNLLLLALYDNNLSGVIPPTLWNSSSLALFSVVRNELSGTIPPSAFNNLPHLQGLYISYNHFHGHIPTSIANASNLRSFQIGFNFFSGTVPPQVGGLQGLQWLVLVSNSLEANKPNDWEFFTALTNCSKLQYLELDSNRFKGAIPFSISNLSTSLEFLALSGNKIFGTIPEKISNLIGLRTLALEDNYLSGTLPPSLSMLHNLGYLSLQNNNLGGHVQVVGNLTQLSYLFLQNNGFGGSIPNNLGNLTTLLEFNFASNNLIGTIPISLLNIPTLTYYLNLSHNLLEGHIPHEVGNLKGLVYFDANSNKLSGQIPATLGQCQFLQYLNLHNNTLRGSIPLLFSGLKGLEIIDLSSNNLSGHIPKFLGNMSTISYLNLSFNNFVGEVPTFGVFANISAISVEGNGKLCGGIQELHFPPCSSQLPNKRHKFPVTQVVVSIIATLGILLLVYFFLTWHKKRSTKNLSTLSMKGRPIISYSQLVKATDGFSTANLMGNGTFGSVYKGKLDDESGDNTILVAVKVLKLQAPGALKSFTAECESMRNLRHRNLVKIITSCSSIDFKGDDFKAIVFEFMPNGSLEDWLHPNRNNQCEERHLSLLQRVSILFDVAYALDYLHFHGVQPIVHCDLKPSNILLDADMVAHIGDFGLARIHVEGCSSFQPSTSSMGVRGTIGYAPPEYGAGNMVSTHGDIYSYGILILEMLTRKRPTDNTFEHGLSLRKYAEMALNNRVMDIIDIDLVIGLENEPRTVDDPLNKKRVNSLIALLKIGMFCSEEMPTSRMSTKDIIKELHVIKKALA